MKYFSARRGSETILYLVGTVLSFEGNAQTIPMACADARYLKGYAYLELGQEKKAITWIKRAIELSPANSKYLSELGHLYQSQKKWDQALATFQTAEQHARTFSPEHLKDFELARALRGSAFSLIELGRLDEAEKKYRECLKIDSHDNRARSELGYIQELRFKEKQ